MKTLTCSVLALGGLLLSTSAHAHIKLTAPAPRHTSQKDGPCGKGAVDPRGTTPTTFKPGETITVTWQETIEHPGHFRIAFDENGQRFTDPIGPNDVAPREYVLKDNIKDKTGAGIKNYSETITLPNVQCTNCTLQVVQVMTDKQGNGWGNDDLYYQCADIVLAGGDGGAPVVDGGASSSSSSSGGASSSSSSSGGSGSSSSGAASSSSSGTPATSSSSGSTGEPTTAANNSGDDDGCNVHGERTTPAGLGALALAAVALVLGRIVRRRKN